MQISVRCVLPDTSISRLRKMRSTSHGGGVALRTVGHFLEGDLELVQPIVPRLVDARRLARRPDEHAGEHVGERRMVLPIGDQAPQQIGPAQERRVRRARGADHDVIAAARAGVAAVEHEFLGAEPRLPRFFVERRRDRDLIAPALRRMDVHLDHAGIGRHLDQVEPRIVRRRIAFDVNRGVDARPRHLRCWRADRDSPRPFRSAA